MNELIELMVTPIGWVLIFMLFGLILEYRQRPKRLCSIGQILIILAGLVLYLFSIPAISDRLLYSLESQCRRPDIEVLSSLDLVVVLGAGYYPSIGFRESAEPSGLGYARVFGGVKAFKNSGATELAFCDSWRKDAQESGADAMKAFAIELGVQENKIITESRSTNTMENATKLKRLLVPQKQRQIGVATSALHMLRSEYVFRKVFAGDKIVPIPVGYRYTPSKRYLKSIIPSSESLQTSTEAIHELIGMVWYVIRYNI
jgi:uncharacterized SAM-binding protein YcdF (DUF218 family)